MNEKDLNYFCAAFEARNLRHAAQKVYITTQGLSKAIARLEKELKVSLFTRTQTGIIPTAYAEALYINAHDIIRQLNEIRTNVLNAGELKKQEMTLALTLGVIDYCGVDFIINFKKEYPNINLNIIQNPDVRTDEILRSGKAEIGFLAGPIDTTFYNAELFTSHKHCLVIHQSHPLASKKYIRYEDLDGEPIALEGREFQPFHNNMNRFLKHNTHPNIVLETTEIESTHKFATQNNGIGLSVDFCAFSHPFSNTVIRPFEDKECTWDTFLVTRKGFILSENAKLFHAYAMKWIETHRDKLFHWDL